MMKLTATVKLRPTPAQAALLHETLLRSNAACNFLSKEAWATQTFRQFDLHKIAYRRLREKFGLALRRQGGGRLQQKVSTPLVPSPLRTALRCPHLPVRERRYGFAVDAWCSAAFVGSEVRLIELAEEEAEQ